MVNRIKTDSNDYLTRGAWGNHANNNLAKLLTLLEQGENADIEDYELVHDWINIVFEELRSFPSEHRTLRLHYIHLGCRLLSICIDKSTEAKAFSYAS